MWSHSVASRGNEAGRVAERIRSGWNRGGGGQYGAGLDLIGPRPVTGDFAFVQIELRRQKGFALGVGKDGVRRHHFPSSKFLSFNGLHEPD